MAHLFVIGLPLTLAFFLAFQWRDIPSHPGALVFDGVVCLVFAIVIGWHSKRPIVTLTTDGLTIGQAAYSWSAIRDVRFGETRLEIDTDRDAEGPRRHVCLRRAAPPHR